MALDAQQPPLQHLNNLMLLIQPGLFSASMGSRRSHIMLRTASLTYGHSCSMTSFTQPTRSKSGKVIQLGSETSPRTSFKVSLSTSLRAYEQQPLCWQIKAASQFTSLASLHTAEPAGAGAVERPAHRRTAVSCMAKRAPTCTAKACSFLASRRKMCPRKQYQMVPRTRQATTKPSSTSPTCVRPAPASHLQKQEARLRE